LRNEDGFSIDELKVDILVLFSTELALD